MLKQFIWSMLLNFDIFSYQLYVAEHNIVHVYTAELNILLADHSYSLSKDIPILSKLGRVILLISGFFFCSGIVNVVRAKLGRVRGTG